MPLSARAEANRTSPSSAVKKPDQNSSNTAWQAITGIGLAGLDKFRSKLKTPPNFFKTYFRRGHITGYLGVVVLVVGGAAAVKSLPGNDTYGSSEGKGAAAGQQRVGFEPLLPYDTKTGKTKSLGVSTCPDKRDSICFNDRFLGVNMVVTEQKLPADLKANPNKLKNLADNLKGSGSYREAVSSNGRGYVISYQDVAPQRVVFATKQLLIFIQSSQNLEISEWQQYFETLVPAA